MDSMVGPRTVLIINEEHEVLSIGKVCPQCSAIMASLDIKHQCFFCWNCLAMIKLNYPVEI